MSKLFKPLMISALVAGAVGNVQAESSVNWVATAGLSQKILQLGIGFDGGTQNTSEASFVALELGATAVFESFYVSAVVDQSLTEGEFDNFTEKGSSDSVTFTLGCNCLASMESLSMFVGYTSIDILSDGGAASQSLSTDKGLFFGASYPVIASDKGQLVASLAFAQFDGETVISGDAPLIGGDVFTLTGDTVGVSFGAVWSGMLTETLDYSVYAKVNNYLFDVDTFSSRDLGTSVPLNSEIDHVFTILGAKVSYFF